MLLKNYIQNVFNSFGYKISKNQALLKYEWIKQYDIKTVIDVGANRGQSVELFHDLFPKATVVAFEPIPKCYEALIKTFGNKEWFKSYCVALGDSDFNSHMFQNEFTPSSSLLVMADLHKTTYPHTTTVSTIPVEVMKLDSVLKNISIVKNILMKIDVQGYENRVINGAEFTLRNTSILIIEINIQELYHGQPSFNDIYNSLVNIGFSFLGNIDQLHHPQDGKILQIDSVFVNANSQVNQLIP